MRWKVREFLDKHDITPYRLWQDSRLAQGTVYSLAANKGERVDLKTLAAVITTLERLTKKRVNLDDVLEVVRDG